MGDQILVTTANILKANVRGADVVARYGGEEFILVFPHTEYPLLKTICERIVRAFRETRHDVGTKRDLNVTISIGMATHNDGRQFKSVEELLKAADKALYTAKLRGAIAACRSISSRTVSSLTCNRAATAAVRAARCGCG